MNPFEPCDRFYSDPEYARELGWPTNPRMARALGLYPFFVPVEGPSSSTVMLDGRRLVMIGSNNYLGLTGHPEVIAASQAAVEEYGTGCTGSRFLNGTIGLHLELERRLAAFVGKPAALVFSTGFQTNLGVITALSDRHTVLVCDKEVHASIIDAVCLARDQNKAEVRFYRHGDPAGLDRILGQYAADRRLLVITDGVFSMGGDVAPLADLVRICRDRGAGLILDDAHGIGVLGEGHGTAAHFGLTEQVDVIIGTFSKSLASMGGFVAASEAVIQWIQHRARAYMFSASLSPASTAAALAALTILEREPERVSRVNAIADRARTALSAMGFDVGRSCTPIVPVLIGDQFRTLQAWERLRRAGVYTNVALPPAVRAEASMLRTSYMATHTDADLAFVLRAFEEVKRRLGPAHQGRKVATADSPGPDNGDRHG